MQFSVTREGIEVKKGLSTKLIPFDTIRSIEIDLDNESSFRTQDREEFKDKMLGYKLSRPDVYTAIGKYNISFVDHCLQQFHKRFYKEEELVPLLGETKKNAQVIADQYVKEHLGQEYSVEVVLDKDYEHHLLYFSLLKDGEIQNLSQKLKVLGGSKVPTSFDCVEITELIKWNTTANAGLYGVTDEVTDPDECRYEVEKLMESFCDRFQFEEKKQNTLEQPEEQAAAKPKPAPKDHLVRRYSVFLLGLFIASMGVAFSTVAELGTSPVASVPYSVSRVSDLLSFGGWLNLLSVIQITVQILLLKSRCNWLEITVQTILAFVYGYLTNFSCWLLEDILLVTYGAKLIFMLLGCIILALGIWVQFKADVAMLPGEAMNRAISQVTGKRYENVKIFFDIFYITLAAVICLGFLGKLEGVREGSIVAAILVGLLIKLYNRIWKKITTRKEVV